MRQGVSRKLASGLTHQEIFSPFRLGDFCSVNSGAQFLGPRKPGSGPRGRSGGSALSNLPVLIRRRVDRHLARASLWTFHLIFANNTRASHR